jgi:subtilisin family serine protease
MAEQADLGAAYTMDWVSRGWYVYNMLKETAERTQAPVIAALEAASVRYQSFISGNEIYVFDGSRAALNQALWAGEIQEVRAPVEITLAAPRFELMQPGPVPQNKIQTTAWGLGDTHAPEFWAQFGLRGEGVRVASIDTGAQWDHPALREAYACKDAPSNSACWRDATVTCPSELPCDDQGHGTHTIGTMIGSDDPTLPHRVGMAPGAQWIACKACSGTSCNGSNLAACADWLLAPGGNPNNRPQVVNNSWGGAGGNLWFTSKVESWRAAGIFPVFSAGNDGQKGCSSLNSPGDYPQSFSVAAHDRYGSTGYFSSCGPSTIGGQPYTKPNLTAPGVVILSAMPTNGWANFSGTSMAAPHVAGAAALLYSCAPALRGNMTATFELLQQTADPPLFGGNCGTPDGGQSNYTYGYGYLNVLRAGQAVCPIGQVQGNVRALSSSQPIPNSRVVLNWIGVPRQLITDASGFFQTSAVAQTYQLTASAEGYCSATQPVTIAKDTTTTVNLSLIECPNRLFLPTISR